MLCPPITVVIPAYNVSAYLKDAIGSVVLQQYDGQISILVLDDGSTDCSLEVAKAMAAISANIRVETQTNQGRAKTRNRLLDLAETDLVAWLDGDDIASPTWIAEQVGYLCEHDECVAVSGQGYSMTATGNAIGPINHPLNGEEIDSLHLAGKASAFLQSCVVVRKSAVIQAGGYNERYACAEDYDLWLRLAEVGKLANVSGRHLYYRVHATSANWTVNIQQRTQGHEIVNEARVRRGVAPFPHPSEVIPPPKKDDWNRRIYWVNIALKSGNPLSALQMMVTALRRHPGSLVMWLAAAVSVADTILFLGNKTTSLRPGASARIGSLPQVSFYRAGRALIRFRRGFRSPIVADSS